MATQVAVRLPSKAPDLVEMSWDPITRIVGSLGIHTKIDFANRRVAECHSTSSIFRGYSVFMKGKDPRDAHFITSRICGICGDNHATCACYAQNMAFGVQPAAIWPSGSSTSAKPPSTCSTTTSTRTTWSASISASRWSRRRTPACSRRPKRPPAPHCDMHGYRTIADIMRSLNPFTGVFYREALQMSRLTREMFCLMEGRHVHPSTLYPGGVGTVPRVQLFTDYLVRLMKYVEFMKRVVPLHDDLFDFFYEALPGYEEVGQRRVLLGCWGSFNNPDVCDYTYANMAKWGRAMYRHARHRRGRQADHHRPRGDQPRHAHPAGQFVLRRLARRRETFVKTDPLGNPVDQRHPWNQTTTPTPQKRDFDGKYTWVMSPRWFDKRTGKNLALDTGGGPLARFWVTALAGQVDIGYVEGDRAQRQDPAAEVA